MEIREAAEIISAWAKTEPHIRKVHFYGSRVKGTHRAESDLDIAIELMPTLDESGGLATWMDVSDGWREELSALLQYEVQIEWDDGPRTGVIAQGLSEASLLVYERKIKHPLQIQRLTSNGFVI